MTKLLIKQLELFKKIRRIIPLEFRQKSLVYTLVSLANVVLDLFSVAYFIPLFIFILDKDQMPSILKDITFLQEDNMLFWITGVVLIFILKNIIQLRIIKFQSFLVFDIATVLSTSMTKVFLSSPLEHVQKMDKGKEIQKIQMSGTDFANRILLSINTLFTEAIVIASISITSLVLYPKFSLIIFAITSLSFFAMYMGRKRKVSALGSAIRESYSTATSHLINIIDGFLEIKSLGKEVFFQDQFRKTLQVFNANFARLKQHQSSNTKYLEIIVILGLCIFLFYINRSFDITSEKVLLISYVAGISLKLFPSLNSLILAYTNFKSYAYSVDILEATTKVILPKEKALVLKETLSLHDISFSYSNKINILEQVSLTLQRGKMIGIKGVSGSGKTTLLHIFMGLLTPKEGYLSVDKTPISSCNDIFPFVCYVPQHPFFFNGSLLDNIIIHQEAEAIDMQRINQLIEALSLTSFVSNLKDGLQTMFTHDSRQISGGQKQRIALLRALYAQPHLLILDEITNQLDEALAFQVLLFLQEYCKQHHIAILLASHAPIVAKICNETYIIEKSTLKDVTHA